MDSEEEKKTAAKVGRDSDYRISALTNAVNRAGQDGGLEGSVDVLKIAEVYYNWLLGTETLEKPEIES